MTRKITWFSVSQHLGAIPPESGDFQEMVCQACMKRCPFLWAYAAQLAGKSLWSWHASSLGRMFSTNQHNLFSIWVLATMFLTVYFYFILCGLFSNFLFCMGEWLTNNAVSFRWTAEGLSHKYTCIHSPPDFPPIQAATQHWAEFHVANMELFLKGPDIEKSIRFVPSPQGAYR